MHFLFFYMQFAVLQAEKFGRAVTVTELQKSTGYSRSQVNRYLKTLIASNFIHKPKRGKYYLADCRGALAIGFSVVDPMEMLEYYTRAQNAQKSRD